MAETAAAKLPPPARLALFSAALAAIWSRAGVTLGTVTLAAIAERVTHAASRKSPLLAAVAVEDTGFELALLGEAAKEEPDAAATAALRTLLVELLVVLGRLTAEILTPALHAEIARVRPSRFTPEKR